MKIIRLTTPLKENDVKKLRVGDIVEISGKIVTARDKVYARVVGGEILPVDLRGGVIYHCGPLAKRTAKGWQIISAGPTTSARMDPMQAEFVRRTKVRGLVGKGGVGAEVTSSLTRMGCVYMAHTGGAGVLAANQVKKVEDVFWKELGPEAIWVLRVRDFGPLVVAVDTAGGNLYFR